MVSHFFGRRFGLGLEHTHRREAMHDLLDGLRRRRSSGLFGGRLIQMKRAGYISGLIIQLINTTTESFHLFLDFKLLFLPLLAPGLESLDGTVRWFNSIRLQPLVLRPRHGLRTLNLHE